MLSFTQKNEQDRPQESIGDFIPDRDYSKQEIVKYLEHSRESANSLWKV
jgi:hypothetical protein